MHHFYLPDAESQGTALALTEGEAHHALHVVRVRRGERVAVLDGAGHEFICEVQEADRHTVALSVKQKISIAPLPYQVVLAQAVTKGKSMDLIIQKATELGVHRIAPILSERTVPQVEEESAMAKAEKWQAVAVAALKQCGAAWLPKVDAPVTPQVFLAAGETFALSLIATLQNDARHPREHFENFRKEHQRS
ncbi:MAG: 16S rRNA (uracil(1498)-N(3))-methyltransferase, partial [Verrucomicrobiales bacterium]|nr:16S rRNA (uracil(1498)-N(3))-methyltransferase [Verrucomicrobiales bacterium]